MKKYLIFLSMLVGLSVFAQLHKFTIMSEPLKNKSEDSKKINELFIFNDKLYIGYGDYGVNTGPTEIISYNLSTCEWLHEFTVDEEAVVAFKNIDGVLTVPGVDATEEWDYGNIYMCKNKEWKKHRTLPFAVHVFDVAKLNDTMYCATGEVIGEENYTIAVGAVLSSADNGEKWNFDMTLPYDKNLISRVNNLIEFNGNLYAFVYGYSAYLIDDVPAVYRQYMVKPYKDGENDYYLCLKEELLGTNDCYIYKNGFWSEENLINDSLLCNITPVKFKSSLILSATFGRFLNSPSYYVKMNGSFPGNGKTALYVYDGIKTMKLNIDYDIIVDMRSDDLLFSLLLKNNGVYWIYDSKDLKGWRMFEIPAEIDNVLSFEYFNGKYYLGTEDGKIFVEE